MEISKTYDPKTAENKWYAFWQAHAYFSPQPGSLQTPFTIVIPPPNVTGSLHMGHALNNTLQDIFIRWKRLQGQDALWMPGTDHGGIATQNVVEKILKKEGKSRHQLGRQKFLERMWQWRQESGDTILMQLQRLGCSCDWSRTRFTMDEVCSRAVVTAFGTLFQQGLIYVDDRIVTWCPRCGTALADIEVEHEDRRGSLWHIFYPAEKGTDGLTVATTRPETMLGDTAVAVHPSDERYKSWAGKNLRLPLTGRLIPVVADEAIDPAFGTGAVKVTPAHDAADFEISRRHKLPRVVVIDFNGKISKDVPTYGGLERFEARAKIVEDLKAQGLLKKEEPYTLAAATCYRCGTVVEPLTSPQWYLSVKSMAERARAAVDSGQVRFHPERWKDDTLRWLDNLKDWCISRQIWWGHRIPLWYCLDCDQTELMKIPSQSQEEIFMPKPGSKASPIVGENPPASCPRCRGSHLVQDANVLDTWFSSALWPFSVFYWPEETPELKKYYPTSVLVTGYEILYLWVARMIMMGLHFRQKVPFTDVTIHGIVRDSHGKKMSKSLGNVIDPLEIMEKYGTDALRFSMAKASVLGRDIQLSDGDFIGARNFANKLWNASRFVLMNLEGWKAEELHNLPEGLEYWIVREYEQTRKKVTEALERYDPAEAVTAAYQFFWDTFCDWYLELAKPRLTGQNKDDRQQVQTVLVTILSGVLRLLHPTMPYLTEEIWQTLRTKIGVKVFDQLSYGKESIMVAPWPKEETKAVEQFQDYLEEMKFMTETVVALRTIRSEKNVPPAQPIHALINAKDLKTQQMLQRHHGHITTLAKVGTLELGTTLAKPPHSAVAVIPGAEIFVPLAGLIDFDKERERIKKELERLVKELGSINARLSNQDFLKNAPKPEVDKVTQKKEENRQMQEKLRQNLEMLQ